MLLLTAPACADEQPHIEYGPPEHVADLANEHLTEVSGLAISRLGEKILWTHNDSGDTATIYAVGPAGEDLAAFTLLGVRAIDWEDIASFKLGETSWLMIADTGDNNERHAASRLIFVREPAVKLTDHARRETLRADAVLTFRYEDKPHNVEGAAVDPTTHEILLMTKVILGAGGVFTLPLPDLDKVPDVQTAHRIASLWINMATGMDLSPDGRRLLIGTYGPAYEFTRRDNESWPDALKRAGRQLPMPRLAQGEAICYSTDGKTIYLSGEKRPTPLWRVPLLAK
ncbi:MAG: hypothetical protein GC162_17725 [Planctomycetes bacterium]|nr:hypothetical protein [Planctomycetota bacterium]